MSSGGCWRRSRRPRWRFTFTIHAAPPWPTSWWPSKWGSPPSTPRWVASAAALTRRVPPVTSRPWTSSTCWREWASAPESTSTSWSTAAGWPRPSSATKCRPSTTAPPSAPGRARRGSARHVRALRPLAARELVGRLARRLGVDGHPLAGGRDPPAEPRLADPPADLRQCLVRGELAERWPGSRRRQQLRVGVAAAGAPRDGRSLPLQPRSPETAAPLGGRRQRHPDRGHRRRRQRELLRPP